MTNLNLTLRFTLAHDAAVQTRSAARIRVDGRGALIVYDAETGTAERIPLEDLNTFCIDTPAAPVRRHIN